MTSNTQTNCPNFGKTILLPSPGKKYNITCKNCLAKFLFDPSSEMTISKPSPRIETLELKFKCAKTGQYFISVFARQNSQRFHVIKSEKIEAGKHVVCADSFLNTAHIASINLNEISFNHWICPYCQHVRWPEYVQCSRCQDLVCGGRVTGHDRDNKVFHCCDRCQNIEPVITGQLSVSGRREAHGKPSGSNQDLKEKTLSNPNKKRLR